MIVEKMTHPTLQGLFTLLGWMTLRAKIGPDKAEPEGFGGSIEQALVLPEPEHNDFVHQKEGAEDHLVVCGQPFRQVDIEGR
jgi:hypothetical protein